MIDYYRGSINPNRQIYSAPASAQTPYNAYAKYGAGASFDENYAPLAQASATSLSRNATQAQNDYYNKAAGIQNSGALRGLQLLGQQRANAHDRQNSVRDMQYKWMNDMMIGGSGLLGGLL